MMQRNYLQLVAEKTPTQFWNDSAEPAEIQAALANGASGVTTNPILVTRTVQAHPERWHKVVRELARTMPAERIPHEITAQVVTEAADLLLPVYRQTGGKRGYVCAQVNPTRHGDTTAMVAEAMEFHALRPNIAVKIPVTAAGLDAIEELASRGVTTTGTTSFTVPQVLNIAEAFRRGKARRKGQAVEKNVRSFAVIMAGRLDDHLRDEVKAGRGTAAEEAIIVAGLAVAKRAYRLFREHGYESTLLIGGMRGHYHVTGLVGGGMILTVAPAMQAAIIEKGYTVCTTIEEPVPADLLAAISAVPDFRRAYEPDGMAPAEFATFGATVKTQGQFIQNFEALQAFVQEALR